MRRTAGRLVVLDEKVGSFSVSEVVGQHLRVRPREPRQQGMRYLADVISDRRVCDLDRRRECEP